MRMPMNMSDPMKVKIATNVHPLGHCTPDFVPSLTKE